jgi:predicted RNA-binding protein YlxR (DUF448 family)
MPLRLRPDGNVGGSRNNAMGETGSADRQTEQAGGDTPPAVAHADVDLDADHVPERTCALTREKREPADLLRFVRAPDGTITPDIAGKLPGRGVWLSLDRSIVDRAARQNPFSRSLKRPVVIPEDLAERVERLLRQRCVGALAMAKKAGLVVSGFSKVDAAIGSRNVAALLHAAEAADDGADRLDRKLIARSAAVTSNPASVDTPNSEAPGERTDTTATTPAIVKDLSVSELSLALGRENVVHAALSTGGAARHFLTEIGRLRRYRSTSPAAAGRPPLTSNTE